MVNYYSLLTDWQISNKNWSKTKVQWQPIKDWQKCAYNWSRLTAYSMTTDPEMQKANVTAQIQIWH